LINEIISISFVILTVTIDYSAAKNRIESFSVLGVFWWIKVKGRAARGSRYVRYHVLGSSTE